MISIKPVWASHQRGQDRGARRGRVRGPARAGSSAPAGSSNRRGESIDQESCGAILVEVLVGERVSEIDS